jgi:hypothetical protein
MDQGMMKMVIGFVGGCVIASGIWALALALFRNERRTSKQRRAAMQDIASECAEIDGKLPPNAMKTISFDEMNSAVMPRLEKVRRMLTANMPLFDVYYVKYVESLIARYQDVLPPYSGKEAARREEKSTDIPLTDNKAVVAPESIGGGHFVEGQMPINFDQTWQFDFSKEKSGHGDFGKKESAAIEEKAFEPTFEALTDMGGKTEAPGTAPIPSEETVKTPEQSTLSVATPMAAPVAEKHKAEVKESADSSPIKEALKQPELKTAQPAKAKETPEIIPPDVEKEIAVEFERSRAPKQKEKTSSAKTVEEKKTKTTETANDSANAEILLPPETTAIQEEPEAISIPKEPVEEFISGEDLVDKIDTFFGIKE